MKKATHQSTREHNRHLVLKTVFEHKLTSRAEIARITSLTRTTVSEMIADLIQEGLVSEVGVGSSLGGKSPILLSLEEDSRYLIGLDLAQDEFRGAVVNLRGKIKHMVTLSLSSQDSREPLSVVYQIVDKLMQAACQLVIAISAGTPGLVNTSEVVVVNVVNQDWRNLPLASLLQQRYRLPGNSGFRSGPRRPGYRKSQNLRALRWKGGGCSACSKPDRPDVIRSRQAG